MSTLKWVRGVNGTLGWFAPKLVASKMRLAFMTPRDFPPRDWELPLLAKSERITLRFGLSALRWGQGPAVLLMHGWEGRPTQFASLITALVDAGYSVVALDGPAHGRSPGREANVVLFARALLEAAAELPPLQAVIGHSMGGARAMLAVQMGLRPETLVRIGPPAGLPPALVRLLPPVAIKAFELTPDGRFSVEIRVWDYSGANATWIRPLDGSTPRPLPKTVGATQLFWAPDSQRLGFFTPGKLQIVDVVNGGIQDVCPIDVAPRGATWNAAGDIVFARAISPGSLSRVRDSGGTPVEFAKPDLSRQEATMGFPQFLPDGRHFLYLSIGTDPARRAIYAGSLDGGASALIVASESMPVYVPGWLLHVRGTALLANAFDAERLRLIGEPVQVADGVMGTANATGRFAFSASDTGLLAIRAGAAAGVSADLTWVSRDGRTGTVVGDSRPYVQIRLSPDEKRVVFGQPDSRGLGNSLWTVDLTSGITSQLTVEVPAANDPVWSHDSETVAFEAAPQGSRQIYRQTIGSRSITPIFESPDDPKWLDDWSRDGPFLLPDRRVPQARDEPRAHLIVAHHAHSMSAQLGIQARLMRAKLPPRTALHECIVRHQ